MHTTPTAPTRILVTGATGKTGRRILDRLRTAAPDVEVRAVSRSTSPRADWTDETTWDAVLADVDVAYLCYSPDLAFPGAAEVVGAFARRAASAGVRRAVLLSGRGEALAEEAEQAVRDALPVTVLRSSWMAQNFSEDFLLDAVRHGAIAVPAPIDVGEGVVDADDVADVAVATLLDDAHVGAVHELSGPDLLTVEQMAAVLSGAVGRPVEALRVPREAWIAGAVADGFPQPLAELYAGLFDAILDGRNAHLVDGIRSVLGRPARRFADYAARTADEGAWRLPEPLATADAG